MVEAPFLHSRDRAILKMQVADVEYLERYTKEVWFDLYYQSPWTAGSHMVEILHASIDTGVRLFHSRGTVAAVLHVYNALRQLKSIDQISLLDELCEVFRDEIFLGSLPKENFSSCFRRFLGGSLQTQAPTQHGSTNDRRRRTGIGMPTRLPSGRDSTRRIMPGEISLFYELHNTHYTATVDFWARLYTGKHSANISKSNLQGIMTQLNTPPFSEPLKRLRAVVLDELTGKLPVAAIKYHAVYVMCLHILNEMAVLALQVEDQPIAHASPQIRFKFVETLLVAIVEHQRDLQKAKTLPRLVSLSLASQAIANFCEGKKLADFVWTF
jgi:hypothetical protein